MADTIQWTQTHAINPTWLRYPLSTTLNALLEPSIEHLQRWNIPRATTCPPNDTKKSDLPLSIPGPQLIQTWPKALFPTQGDFGRHIKTQQKTMFLNKISQTQRDHVHAVGITQLSLHRSSNLRNNTSSKSQLWQCSTSLFSLTSFYELSNEAFLTSTSILLGIPVPHALYLQATQRQELTKIAIE